MVHLCNAGPPHCRPSCHNNSSTEACLCAHAPRQTLAALPLPCSPGGTGLLQQHCCDDHHRRMPYASHLHKRPDDTYILHACWARVGSGGDRLTASVYVAAVAARYTFACRARGGTHTGCLYGPFRPGDHAVMCACGPVLLSFAPRESSCLEHVAVMVV